MLLASQNPEMHNLITGLLCLCSSQLPALLLLANVTLNILPKLEKLGQKSLELKDAHISCNFHKWKTAVERHLFRTSYRAPWSNRDLVMIEVFPGGQEDNSLGSINHVSPKDLDNVYRFLEEHGTQSLIYMRVTTDLGHNPWSKCKSW